MFVAPPTTTDAALSLELGSKKTDLAGSGTERPVGSAEQTSRHAPTMDCLSRPAEVAWTQRVGTEAWATEICRPDVAKIPLYRPPSPLRLNV